MERKEISGQTRITWFCGDIGQDDLQKIQDTLDGFGLGYFKYHYWTKDESGNAVKHDTFDTVTLNLENIGLERHKEVHFCFKKSAKASPPNQEAMILITPHQIQFRYYRLDESEKILKKLLELLPDYSPSIYAEFRHWLRFKMSGQKVVIVPPKDRLSNIVKNHLKNIFQKSIDQSFSRILAEMAAVSAILFGVAAFIVWCIDYICSVLTS